MPASPYAPLDPALDAIAGSGASLAGGNFNHAPMVAEALCAMARPEAVMPWVGRYRGRLLPRPAPGEAIDGGEWRGTLGRRDRFAEWSAFFADELHTTPWQAVLDCWAGRLAPGVSAAATHGAIRVGHAVRALTVGETPQRRRELADALASWAASYRELPVAGERTDGRLAPADAIRRVAVVPPERRPAGNIVTGLAGLADAPNFAEAVGSVDLDGELDRRLAELTELFARVFVANAKNPLTTIVFIHGVTSLAALGHIVPHVGEETARSLLRYGWQAGCGLYAAFGSGAPFAEEVEAAVETPESLIDKAVAHGDEHVIKFAEACLSRHLLCPSPVYPAAVAGVLERMARG